MVFANYVRIKWNKPKKIKYLISNLTCFKKSKVVIKIILMSYKTQELSVLNCRYYGFECNFEVEGKISKISKDMKKHTDDVHGADLTKEFLTQVILRKRP